MTVSVTISHVLHKRVRRTLQGMLVLKGLRHSLLFLKRLAQIFQLTDSTSSSFLILVNLLHSYPSLFYINNSLLLAQKYASIFVSEHYLFEVAIMSEDKYPSIFSPQMEAIVFIILQIFFATRTVLKIGEYS